MVGNGNHPVDSYHGDDCAFDRLTLEEFVLGQLLPQQEDEIQRHLTECAACRAVVAELRDTYRDIQLNLRQELERAPTPQLSFDKIASDWRKPPRRTSFWFRVRQFAPAPSYIFLITLFVMSFLLLIPSANTTALRSLELTDSYVGPTALVAAATDDGLVILQLATDDVRVVAQLNYLTQPRNLQFSPDGRWLACQQDRLLHIFETSENGAHIRISLSETSDWAWSPNSRKLAYTDGRGQLAVFDVATHTNRILVPAAEYAWGLPVWNATSTQVAYNVVNPLPATESIPKQQGIWRLAVDTGYRVEVVRNPQPETMLLQPAAWISASELLAWDINASANGTVPTLYRIDADQHTLEQLVGNTQARGTRLAWPVSQEGTLLATVQEALYIVDTVTTEYHAVGEHIPRPATLSWAPNSAWMAFTVSGTAEGKGLYVLAVNEGELQSIELPDGATEKSVTWAGPEHIFVTRHNQRNNSTELWLVTLTADTKPQRILTNVQIPSTEPAMGWRWQDVLTTWVLLPTAD